jgi:hypothetical protein
MKIRKIETARNVAVQFAQEATRLLWLAKRRSIPVVELEILRETGKDLTQALAGMRKP